MRHRNINAIALGTGLIALPAQAHKTEVSGDVAGTWHLEPNHSPKAGEPARVWVALTQRGGKVIPLEQCDCQLTVYQGGDAAPVLTPTLEPVSPENYQSIPGADITFPEVGEYQLQLTGSPQAGATFTPFELSYTTVVAAGSVPQAEAPASQSETAAPNPPEQSPTPSSPWPLVAGIGVGLIALAAIAARLLLRQRQSE
jgi:hypothetical protein